MTYRLHYLIIFCILHSLGSFSQTILLEENVIGDTIIPTFGPNMKNYFHFYVGYGMILGPDEVGSEINYGRSYDVAVGALYKRKVNNNYAIGMDLLIHQTSFNLKQDTAKFLPNDSTHKNEKLIFYNLSLGLFNRINYGKRGNYMGNYVDVGVRIDWPFSVVHFTKDKYPVATANNGRTVRTRTSALLFTEALNYSIYARMGFTRYVLTASYRLSDVFVKDAEVYQQYGRNIDTYPELPALVVGVEISLYW
ncbi:MAG TPA: hypothetical protein EYN69_07395 [Flavobacteriales bacterium]|nr:hypothetical protein [Flavobacteriales bacterium]